MLRVILLWLMLISTCQASPFVLKNKEGYCLTEAIYYEARGTSLQSQWLVGRVVMNRVGTSDKRSSVCNVVNERMQFSYRNYNFSVNVKKHLKDWEMASRISNMLLNDYLFYDLSDGAIYYTRCQVVMLWKKKMMITTKTDGYCFYKEIII